MQASGGPLGLIAGIIARRKDDPERLAQRIINGLDLAGYEVRRRPGLIPIRPNPGPLGPRRSVPLAGPKP
jgi:hypothetical protein